MVLKIIGGLICLWGVADLVLSWMGTDLWGSVGITLPDLLWQFSHYIAIILGGVIFSMGGSNDEASE